MENDLFRLTQEVDNKETPILSPLITPTTPRSIKSFGTLQLDLNIGNTSPQILTGSNQKKLNRINSIMSGDKAFTDDRGQVDNNMSSVNTDRKDNDGLDSKMGSAKAKKGLLRLDIPKTPASPEPTPTQCMMANDMVMSRRFRFGSGQNSGQHNQIPCVCQSKRPILQTQESIHDPIVPLMHGVNQTESVCNCNDHCVKCGKSIKSEELRRKRQQHHIVEIGENSINSNNPPDEQSMNKSQSAAALVPAETNDSSYKSANKHSMDYSKPKSNCLRNVFLVLLLLLLSIAITVIACYFLFVGTTHSSLFGGVSVSSNGSMCVPCDSLRLTSDQADDHTKSLTRQGDQCCANTPQQTEELIEAIVEKNIRVNEAKTPLRQYQPLRNQSTKNMYAAHVYLGPLADGSLEVKTHHNSADNDEDDEYSDDQLHIADEYDILKGWTKKPPTAFVRPGIVFLEDKGRFRVTREGLYKVYSHLSVNTPPGGARTGLVFSQKISRENIRFLAHETDDVLTDTQVAPCPDIKTSHACHSSNLDALLSLRSGDELFVSVTHPQLIARDKIASFFGIYRVD